MIPGEITTQDGEIELNAGRKVTRLTVTNSGDRPIQVGSHYHFFESNPALKFDRDATRGYRLDIPAGTAVRFEPGQSREVQLVEISGTRTVYGFRQAVMGGLDGAKSAMVLLALVGAILTGGPGPAGAHPPPILSGEQEKGFAAEIQAWRKDFGSAALAKDKARLRALYAPSFVHTDTTGKLSGRDERIALILSGAAVIETAAADNVAIRVPGGWTAVATGRSRLSTGVGKESIVVAWTSSYVRAGQGWQLAGSHEARVEPVQP